MCLLLLAAAGPLARPHGTYTLALSAPAAGVVQGASAGPAAVPKRPAGKPPGERNPLLGLLAGASIMIALGAGIYVYRIIRKGL